MENKHEKILELHNAKNHDKPPVCTKCFYEAIDAGISKPDAEAMSQATHVSLWHGTEALCYTCRTCARLAFVAHGVVVEIPSTGGPET